MNSYLYIIVREFRPPDPAAKKSESRLRVASKKTEKTFLENLAVSSGILNFASEIQGVLAHLARARHWQCRGERFESAVLHPIKRIEILGSLFVAPTYMLMP